MGIQTILAKRNLQFQKLRHLQRSGEEKEAVKVQEAISELTEDLERTLGDVRGWEAVGVFWG